MVARWWGPFGALARRSRERQSTDEGCDLRPRLHGGSGAGEPAAGAPAVRPGPRLGGRRAGVPVERLQGVDSLPLDAAAKALGVSRSTVKRWRRQVQKPPAV